MAERTEEDGRTTLEMAKARAHSGQQTSPTGQIQIVIGHGEGRARNVLQQQARETNFEILCFQSKFLKTLFSKQQISKNRSNTTLLYC